MRILTVFRHAQRYEYLRTLADGHAETWTYQSRYYTVEVIAPADFDGSFVRDGFTVHGCADFTGILAFIEQTGPWDVIVCYGPFGEQEWPLVLMRAGNAVVCLDYAGGPLCDLNGNVPASAWQFDHVFTAHETQARWLRSLGVPATKARGVPTNRYRPIAGVPKQWRIVYPANFSPGKRAPLVAETCERYNYAKPSLFVGHFENPAIVDMTACGGIPLNKPGIPQRNNIQLGGRVPYVAMPLVFNASEFCVVGSQEEAGPWVALEAMACGVPTVVMSDCAWAVGDAFAELERDFGGCRVVPAYPDAIHAAIEEMDADYAVESRKARAAILARYDWFKDFYNPYDLVLKNLVAFKQAGKPA